jgi:hypothetical protein
MATGHNNLPVPAGDDEDDLETRAVAALRRSIPGPLDRQHRPGNYGAVVRARFPGQAQRGVLLDDLCKLLAPLAVRAVLDGAADPVTVARLLRAQPDASCPAWIVGALIETALQHRDEVRALRAEFAEFRASQKASPPGTWGSDFEQGHTYEAGSFVRFRSSLWWARRETSAMPGSDFESWHLVCRGGKYKP